MRVVAIVQARVESSRLPAKIFLDLAGRTALERCLERVTKFAGVSEVVVATTDRPADDLVVQLCKRLGVPTSRGSSDDVLSRYHEAAVRFGADAIVRCTSDSPLLDPMISSRVIDAFKENGVDYASNVLERRLPRGLDTEVISAKALTRAHETAQTPSEREHVTLHVYRNPGAFTLHSVIDDTLPDLSEHRWTLDTLDDYRFLATLFERLEAPIASRGLSDILRIVDGDPTLRGMNAHIVQKST